jgi:hypothetical protein
MARTLVRMPMAARSFATDSPMVTNGGSGVISLASKPWE